MKKYSWRTKRIPNDPWKEITEQQYSNMVKEDGTPRPICSHCEFLVEDLAEPKQPSQNKDLEELKTDKPVKRNNRKKQGD